MTQHVYLIPGFFGFANLGDFMYFAHVRRKLDALFAARGVPVHIHDVPTLPTSGLRRRAGRLLDHIVATAPDDGSPLHLIGHSTGGLDARLLVSPGSNLVSAHPVEPWAARVKSVVSLASPHFGSPVASFLSSVLGQQLLKVLSISTIYAIRMGSIPLPVLLRLARVLSHTGALKRSGTSVLDEIYRDVLKDFNPERRQQLIAFFEQASADQTLLPQLSPEGMDLVNAQTAVRQGVRFGSVLSRARPPSIRANLDVGLKPGSQASYVLFRRLYRVCSTMSHQHLPTATAAQTEAMIRGWGRAATLEDNDAMVPSLSQVWGDVIHATWADHLDVIGWFNDSSQTPPHVDWLETQTGYDLKKFHEMWSDVVAWLLSPDA